MQCLVKGSGDAESQKLRTPSFFPQVPAEKKVIYESVDFGGVFCPEEKFRKKFLDQFLKRRTKMRRKMEEKDFLRRKNGGKRFF